MFIPKLNLARTPGGRVVLIAETECPRSSFSAGPAAAGAPPGIAPAAGILPCTLPLHHEETPAVDAAKTVRHTLDLELGDETVIKAYVTLGGATLGTATVFVGPQHDASLDRPPLTPGFCQTVAVRNAPSPRDFTGDPDQDLSELGVIDKDQAAQHRAKIQADLQKHQYSIAQNKISSGPGVSVGDCSDSVLGHAH